MVLSPLLWTPQARAILESFSAKYRVKLQVYDAFGRGYQYPPDIDPVSDPDNFGHTIMAAYAVGEAYGIKIPKEVADTGTYAYTSVYWNEKAEMYSIRTVLGMNNFTASCFM